MLNSFNYITTYINSFRYSVNIFTAGKHFIEYKHVFLRLEKRTNEFLLKKSPFTVYIVCTVQNVFLLTWNARFRTSRSRKNEESKGWKVKVHLSAIFRTSLHTSLCALERSRECRVRFVDNSVFSELSTLTEIIRSSLKHNYFINVYKLFEIFVSLNFTLFNLLYHEL